MTKKRIKGKIVYFEDQTLTLEICEDDAMHTDFVIDSEIIIEGDYIENPEF